MCLLNVLNDLAKSLLCFVTDMSSTLVRSCSFIVFYGRRGHYFFVFICNIIVKKKRGSVMLLANNLSFFVVCQFFVNVGDKSIFCDSLNLSRVSTCGSRPLVSDASDRWRLSLFRIVCTPSKPAVVPSPGTRVLKFFYLSSTESSHYTDTVYIVAGVWLETHIKPHQFRGSLFYHLSVSGCLVSRYGKFTTPAL